MIVKKTIGAVKVGNLVSRLTVGKEVPKDVLDFWKKTKQFDELLKNGSIVESEKLEKKMVKNEPIRQTEK